MIVSTHVTKDANTIINQIEKNIRQIHTQFGREVQELLTDRGTEFCNDKLDELAFKFGFVHRKASPQDHCEPAERVIQTIETDIRTLLLQSGISLKYWSFAAQSTVYTRNCTYNKKIKDAPVKVVSKYPVKVVLRSFLPFGCPATVWQQTTNKLGSNGLAAVTLCKDIESFGYFFYLPSKRQVISTTNYKIPDFLINPYLKSDEPNIMGKFTEALTRKIGDISEILGNEREIVEAFKDHGKNLKEYDSDEVVEGLEEDARRVQDDILRDIDREYEGEEEGVNTDEIQLEELLENIPERIEQEEESDNNKVQSFQESTDQESHPTDKIDQNGNEKQVEEENIEEIEPEDIQSQDDNNEREDTQEQVTELPSNTQREKRGYESDNSADKEEFEELDDNEHIEATDQENKEEQEENIDNETDTEEYPVPTDRKEDYTDSTDKIEIKKNYEPIARRTRNNKKFRIRFVGSTTNWRKRQINSVYYSDAIAHNKDNDEKVQFQEALQKEYHNLEEMGVFDKYIKVPRKEVNKDIVIPTTPIFTIKRDGTHKARVVARGDLQGKSTFADIDTDILSIESLKIFIILHCKNHITFEQLT